MISSARIVTGEEPSPEASTCAPQATPHAIPDALLEKVAERFKVLGVPSRLRILSSLMNGPLGMSTLVRVTGLEQSNLSRQVTELERAGCVSRVRKGRSVDVEITDPTLYALCELVCGSLKNAEVTRESA